MLELVTKGDVEILLLKNKQKNAVFTIDFYKEEFMNQNKNQEDIMNKSKHKKSQKIS